MFRISYFYGTMTFFMRVKIMKKRILALALASFMVVSMPVYATSGSSSPTTEEVVEELKKQVEEQNKTIAALTKSLNAAISKISSSSSSSSGSSGGSSTPASSPSYRAAVSRAQAAGMTIGEYMNNAIVSSSGVPGATAIGQGGHVVINGKRSNVVFTLSPARGSAGSAQSLASGLGGTLLNVVTVSSTVGFTNASVNFYVKGITNNNLVAVYQIQNGAWTQLTVTECRQDHVVVNMNSTGVLAFVKIA